MSPSPTGPSQRELNPHGLIHRERSPQLQSPSAPGGLILHPWVLDLTQSSAADSTEGEGHLWGPITSSGSKSLLGPAPSLLGAQQETIPFREGHEALVPAALMPMGLPLAQPQLLQRGAGAASLTWTSHPILLSHPCVHAAIPLLPIPSPTLGQLLLWGAANKPPASNVSPVLDRMGWGGRPGSCGAAEQRLPCRLAMGALKIPPVGEAAVNPGRAATVAVGNVHTASPC